MGVDGTSLAEVRQTCDLGRESGVIVTFHQGKSTGAQFHARQRVIRQLFESAVGCTP